MLASLALNAFLAAFAAAVVLAPGVIRRPASAPALREAARQLDPAHRAAFMTLLREDGHRLRPQTQQARSLRRDVWTSLQAADFDPAAAKAKLALARALNIEARGAVEDSVIDFAATLPKDQRSALGRALYRLSPPARRPAIGRQTVIGSVPAAANRGPGSSPAPRSPG